MPPDASTVLVSAVPYNGCARTSRLSLSLGVVTRCLAFSRVRLGGKKVAVHASAVWEGVLILDHIGPVPDGLQTATVLL